MFVAIFKIFEFLPKEVKKKQPTRSILSACRIKIKNFRPDVLIGFVLKTSSSFLSVFQLLSLQSLFFS